MKPETESKRKLLEAAIELIWQSSYGAVSVDDICAKAGVNKGSFYYAFKSKSDLAVAALERHWEGKRAVLDTIFSPQVAPLQRLELWMQGIVDDQLGRYRATGKMLGCPFCSIGSELGTQDEAIRRKADEVGARVLKYVESLVRDLAADGLIEPTDVAELAKESHSYVVGVMVQAKIENNPKHIERLLPGMKRLLGVKAAPAQPALA